MSMTEQDIRERWFYKHEAEYTETGDFKVLTWRRPNEWAYAMRYVFDGYKMYVSGDLGEALFVFTESATPFTFQDYGIDYFTGKLRAYHESRWDFDSDKAVKRLNDLKREEIEYDHDEMRELFEKARECTSRDEWAFTIHNTNILDELDCDHWEWSYSAGDEYPVRLRSYLVGIKMAAEQLQAASRPEDIVPTA